MSEKKGLPRPPLFTSDYIAMAEILEYAMGRFGQLILALMYYTADGTVPEDLPVDLSMMFSIYQRKIDAAREKYERKCATNADNGRLGGQAKAENAKRAAATTFKPPTLKQFQAAVKHFVGNDEIEPTDSYAVDVFYDSLKEAGWTIGGEPIQRRTDWESAILAKFYQHSKPPLPPSLYYRVFERIFSEFRGLRDPDGRSQADDTASEFFDTFDERSKNWEIEDETFPQSEWQTALAQFMKQYSESSDT